MSQTTDSIVNSPPEPVSATPAAEGAYVAFRPCGCPVMATMEHCRDAGREVAKSIRRGERVERMTLEGVRSLEWRGCDQCRPQRKKSGRAA